MPWHFEFYRTSSDGTRLGGDKVTDGSSSIELAIAQAKSMMQKVTFPFGKATICVIKKQDGSLVCGVSADVSG